MNRFRHLLCASILALAPGAAFAEVFTEDFADPLGGWTTDWFYANSNAENYYVASGNCDPDYRGNNPPGLWISDDRGCGTLQSVSPVVIQFLNGFGDAATAFSIDICSFSATTLNVLDKDGGLVESVPIPSGCGYDFQFINYAFSLPNGISRFEFVGGSVEGNTAIDNVVLDTTPGAPPPARATFRVTKDFSDNNPAGVEITLSCNSGLPLEQSATIHEHEPEICQEAHEEVALQDVPHRHGFHDVTFVVSAFGDGAMDCSISETPLAGYTPGYEVSGDSSGTADAEGCHFEDVGHGDANACVATNTLEKVRYTVNKEWVFPDGADTIEQSVHLVRTCENFRTSADGYLDSEVIDESTFGPGAFPVTVDLYPNYGTPATRCRAVETQLVSGVESDQGCAGWSTLALDGGASCTITNTVFFEGIPVLGRTGLILLSLLTLGVGVVAMRRFF